MIESGDREALAQRALEAMRTGRDAEAESLWRQVLAANPAHPMALLHLGQRALQSKDYAMAGHYLDRARAAAPKNPVIPLNQSFRFRALDETDAELAALTAALDIDPYFYPALLSRGRLEERLGNVRAAARTYRDVLKIAPPRDQVAPPMRVGLEHAQEVVRADSEALDRVLEARLAEARTAHPGESFDRMDHCKDVATGRRKVYASEPAMLLVPYLPAIQFFDNAVFPWLGELEDATEVIREEFLKVFTEDNRDDFVPYIDRPAGVPLNQWAELNRNPRWSVFPLWQHGVRVDRNCGRCPRTAEAVSRLPLCAIPGFAPNVVFSLLAPKTTIPSHSGDTNARLIGHLPLIVPENCRFRVGNETREWRVGKTWLFDDTVEHEAWNDSDALRVILMIDVWNPYLSEDECSVVSDFLLGIHRHYHGGTG